MTKLEQLLYEAYEKRGINFVYETCSELLNIKDSSQKKPKVNGDVCETLLVFLTKKYIEERQLTGNFVRSLVLRDPDRPKSPFRTEIDFLFYTPKIIFCIECKSYFGKKIITDKCTLDNGRYSCDIYKQNVLHTEVLHRNIISLKYPKYRNNNKFNITMGTFFFANGDILDKRDNTFKSILPVLTQNNLFFYYDTMLSKCTDIIWDYPKIDSFLQTIAKSEKLHNEHKEYLRY